MSNETMTLKVIAHIHTAFPTKFGIPRQSGLVDGLRGEIIFTPEYRNADALRGLEDFSHIWLVWQFSGAVRESRSPTVRPPRLGGNTRMGVFATRSPFRPNPLGLSSVRLEAIEHRPEVGPVLIVRGADLMDGTPIYDIKPYIPYADCHSDAAAGFTAQTQTHRLQGRLGLLGSGQQGAGIGQKGLPGIGQADRFAHPVEERRFQFSFQLGHLRGDSRLGIPQLPCRTGKAVQLRNMQKGVDGTQFHGGTSQRRVMPVTVRTAPSTTKWTSNPENSIPYTRSGSCW